MIRTKINDISKLFAFLFCFLCTHSYALPKNDFIGGPVTKMCSYTLKESHTYKLPLGVKMNDFSKLDLVKFQNKDFTRKHTFSLEANNEYSHAVDYISSTNIYPEWMPYSTENVVFSQLGYVINSKANRRGSKSKTKNYSYSQHELETFEFKKESFISSGLSTHLYTTAEVLNFAGQSETAELSYTSDGITITDGPIEVNLLQNGNYTIKDNSAEVQIMVSPANLLVSVKQKQEYGYENIIAKYMINTEGALLPKTITLTTPLVVESGHCVDQVIKREYSDYKFKGFDKNNFSMNLDGGAMHYMHSLGRNKSSNIITYPNPVQNTLYLDQVQNAKNAKLVISDATGSIVSGSVECQDENSLSVDVTNLSSGIYFITILSNSKLETFKFVKQ